MKKPVNLANKTHNPNAGLRGDYGAMGNDFTVQQHMASYTDAQQDRWQRLVARQLALIPNRGCKAYLDAVSMLDMGRGIPSFDALNVSLRTASNWSIVAVPGLLPDEVFFSHLAHRRFPVTVWLREEHEFDYIVEPDLFHDFFGHVPMLFTPVYADYLEAYGKGGLKAMALDALPWLGRLYWFTIEFGLVREDGALRAYGAGVLSSPKELVYALESELPQRLAFDVLTPMRTPYMIDDVQSTYFVLDSLQQLREETRPDFTPLYETLRQAR
jgi:phenylalanine-4-hydroxylase